MEYPKREKFYSHRFCRLLTKTCAAQDLGPEVCWLLTVIAHQEDVKRYKGPVTYWNEQLMPLCGFGGRSRLVLARDKAVEAGWLHYEPGTKGKPGLYWTTIPEHFAETPDAPMDESSDEFCRTEIGRQTDDNGKCRPESGHQVGRQTDGIRTANGRNPDGNQDGKPATFLPVPIPSPVPSPEIQEHTHTREAEKIEKQNREAIECLAGTAYDSTGFHEVTILWCNHVRTLTGRAFNVPKWANDVYLFRQSSLTPSKAEEWIRFSISRNSSTLIDPQDNWTKRNGSHTKTRQNIDDALRGI